MAGFTWAQTIGSLTLIHSVEIQEIRDNTDWLNNNRSPYCSTHYASYLSTHYSTNQAGHYSSYCGSNYAYYGGNYSTNGCRG